MVREARQTSDENMYDEIVIPKITYGRNDDKLLERVVKLKRGTSRILVFMLVGMIMGWFSITYTQDSFIITKVILCIPYKISEAIYTSIIGTDALTNSMEFASLNAYFPQSSIATFLAERITPVLIGMMLYGSMAYFTGDKRVFTLQRFMKFAGVQFVLLVLFISSAYAVNAKAVSDNNHFKDVEMFFLESPDCGEMIRGISVQILLERFNSDLKEDENIVRNVEQEIEIGIIYANGTRRMEAFVNPEAHYIATHGGMKYHVSEEFTACVQEYYANGELTSLETESEE